MLLILAEHVMAAPPKMGPAALAHLGNSLYAPLVLKALASASIKSIGHLLVILLHIAHMKVHAM